MPAISVLLPIYNGSAFLGEAIHSVLQQSFEDFELLLLDDGSTDESLLIAHSFEDPRIRVIERPHNYVSTLNYGLHIAKGVYVARLDADDVMHPDRLRIQHAILEQDPRITLCSSAANLFGEEHQHMLVNPAGGVGYIEDPLLRLLDQNILLHPTVTFRSSFLLEQGLGYTAVYPYAEDYALWVDMAKCGARFYVDSRPLLNYRVHDAQVSCAHEVEQEQAVLRLQLDLVRHLILQKNSQEWHQLYSSFEQLFAKEELDSRLWVAALRPILWATRHATSKGLEG